MMNQYYKEIQQQFGEYGKNIVEDFNKEMIPYNHRTEFGTTISNINAIFLFVFGECVFDIFQFYNSYSSLTKNYGSNLLYWERLSSYDNFLELTYTENKLSDTYAKDIDG